MTAPQSELPHLDRPQQQAPARLQFCVSDLMALVTCGAVGLAISRWLNWYAYQWNRIDVDWLIQYGLLPLAVGMLNLGQIVLYGLHCRQHRRSSDFTPSEFPGFAATGALGVMIGFELLFPNARAAGATIILGVLLTLSLACCFAAVGVVRQLRAGERLCWTEWLGAVAAILPGGTLVYTIVTNLPIC